MTHQLRFVARSDRGLLRSNNQDSVYAGERLLIVADGMGGHAAGDLASRVVVAAFAPLDAAPPDADLRVPLKRALLDGNDAIAEMVQDDPDLEGMGTTATAMLFDGDRMGMVHIGDSRAYLYRNGVLHQLSRDDTFVQSLVDDGRITEDEAAHHPQRNLLLRALNGTEPEPMLIVREISTGDRFLLCSDGLSSVVGAEAIADTLGDPDPESAADRLIELALVAGGPDNVTVIVADVIDVGARSATSLPAGPVDPEATGPIRPIHATQRMPRIPLPAIPDDVPARPDYLDGPPVGASGPVKQDGRRFTGAPLNDRHDDADADNDDDEIDDEIDDDPDFADGRVPRRIPGDRTVPGRRTHRRRLAATIVSAIVVLALAAAGSLVWTRSQYYVGASDGRVVVFRGVPGSVLGISLASVQEDSCVGVPAPCAPIKVDELMPAARDLVNQGIEGPSLQNARGVMARLPDQLLPCGAASSPARPGQPTGSGTGISGGSASAAGTSSASASGTPITVAPLSSSTVPSAAVPSSPASSARPGRSLSSPPPRTVTNSSKPAPASTAPQKTAAPSRPAASRPAASRPATRAVSRAATANSAAATSSPATTSKPITRTNPTDLATAPSKAVGRVDPRPGDQFQRHLIAPEELPGAVAPDRTAGSQRTPATISTAPPSSTPPSSTPPSSAPPSSPQASTPQASTPQASTTPQASAPPSSTPQVSTPPSSAPPSGGAQQNCREVG